MSRVIRLTQREFTIASMAGWMRTEQAQREGQRRPYDHERGLQDSYRQDIDAACAEMAAAHVLGFFPLGLTEPLVHDLYDGYTDTHLEVRHSRRADGHLIVRPRDLKGREPDDYLRYVFVTGAFYDYEVHGWTWETSIVSERYRHRNPGDEPDSWWMPLSHLEHIDTIQQAIIPAWLTPDEDESESIAKAEYENLLRDQSGAI